MDRELWDAGEIVGELVPPGSVFAFLAAHRGEVFDDGFIADLFPAVTGRPSLPANRHRDHPCTAVKIFNPLFGPWVTVP